MIFSFLQQFLFVGNSLSQHNMAKFLTTCLTKKCAVPSCVTYPIFIETVVRSTNCFISCIFFVYFCNFSVKLGGNDFKKKDFESSVDIGNCVFMKLGILGQNLAWGRFSRFLANSVSFVFFKCTNMMISSSLTSPWSLSPLSQTVCS